MVSLEEKIKAIEEELRCTPYNKATEAHIGRLKAKLARLREELESQAARRTISRGAEIKRCGDARVVIVGFPSVGKSTLLNKITNAKSEVGEYDFTTLKIIPGIMLHKGARIQVLDTPGLIEGAASGRGRGREVISIIRNSDLILLLIDVFNPQQLEIIKRELYTAGIRINEKPPEVFIRKKASDGIKINSLVEQELDEKTIKNVLNEYRIHSAEVIIRQKITLEQLIDAILGNRKYIPAIVAINKIDLASREYLEAVKLPEDAILISAEREIGLEKLKDEIYRALDFIRVYLKPPGEKVDIQEPMILKKGATVAEVCDRLHGEFKQNFRYAQVWGESVRYKGQRVGLNHELKDGDILTIFIKQR
ncbi:MAG: GTP-binding protein [Methanocellales archaeon]